MLRKIYAKGCEVLSLKNILWIIMVLAIVLLLPILGCSFVNRASGDDFGFAVYTRNAWVTTYSLIEVIKAACKMVREIYKNWQGTWFTVFLFTLQPEVFSTKAYVVVTFFMLFIWCGSTFVLYKEILKEKMKLVFYLFFQILLKFVYI